MSELKILNVNGVNGAKVETLVATGLSVEVVVGLVVVVLVVALVVVVGFGELH